MCDLRHADIGIGQQRLGGFDVVIGEFWRAASGAAKPTRGGEARLGAFPDQTALEFRKRAKHVKNQPTLRGRRVERFGQSVRGRLGKVAQTPEDNGLILVTRQSG